MASRNNDTAAFLAVGLFLAVALAWITHLVVCLKTGAWGFLIAGAIFFPVGIIHGIGCWFGAW
jgi:hypothetical protein